MFLGFLASLTVTNCSLLMAPNMFTQFTLQPKIAFLCGLAISECLLLQALYAFEHMRERFHPLRSSESSQPAIHLIASLLPQVSV